MTSALGAFRPTVADPNPGRALHSTTVITPEAALLEFRTAGIGSRAMAKLIDLLIQMVLLYLLSVVGLFSAIVSPTVALVLGAVFFAVIIFGYPMTEAFRNGQTLGKKALGLRVITTEGRPVSFRHAFIRSLVGIVEFVVLFGGLGAVLSVLFSRRGQRLGDLAAGTLVVRSRLESPRSVHWAPPRGAEAFAIEFDAGRLSPRQYAVAREFLLRVEEFDPAARFRLAQRLADTLAPLCGVPRPAGVHPEHYLNAAVFAYQERFARSA